MTPLTETDENVLQRLDQSVFSRGLTGSRTLAQAAIKSGTVLINGKVCTRVSEKVANTDKLEVLESSQPKYVSRGGLKLEWALDNFKINPRSLACLDIGASTGGFTDCLLQHGAASVCAVDVGYGQMVATIRDDNRIDLHEHVNARDLETAGITGPFDLIVIDVSFISLTLILDSALKTLSVSGSIIALIKPQFEVGRNGVSKGGIVQESNLRDDGIARVTACANLLGLKRIGITQSPIEGGDGNIEFLSHFKRELSGE